jgi:hypothetical protein
MKPSNPNFKPYFLTKTFKPCQPKPQWDKIENDTYEPKYTYIQINDVNKTTKKNPKHNLLPFQTLIFKNH